MSDLYSPFFLPLRSRSRRLAPPVSPLEGLDSLLAILRPYLAHHTPRPEDIEFIREKITHLLFQHYEVRYTLESLVQRLYEKLADPKTGIINSILSFPELIDDNP